MANNLPITISKDEHLIIEVERSFWGVLSIYLISIFLTAVCLLAAYFVQKPDIISGNGMTASSATYISLMAALLGLLSLIFGYVAAGIYWENRMFITNEAVHQIVRRGLFDKSNQRISLNRVESAKASQKTMLQRLFNYGTLVFATEGQDVDYHITYIKDPSKYPTIFYDTQQQLNHSVRPQANPVKNKI
ncbi:MAG: PH domain-containing protein [Candidatus Saccharimonadales bacterium]|jgi:uncharacterized membrane protein YdbT with pleckstrin-like domain